MKSKQFFSNLPVHRTTLSTLLGRGEHFEEVPADWHVIVTDIKDSTKAFKAGRSEEINLIATGCIIATLNLAVKHHIEVPFFFGGDGATLIVPSDLLEPAMGALVIQRENTLANFGLDLRVGAVPVTVLNASMHALKISRFFVSEIFSIPVVLGEGLAEAERMVKGEDSFHSAPDETDILLDLSGMECRWDKIKPATMAHEVVCLLVSAQNSEKQATGFKHVVDLIDQIYGPYELRNPISRPQLHVKGSVSRVKMETEARLGRHDVLDVAKKWLLILFGRFFFLKQKAGHESLEKLVQLTDTLVIDGRINTVIAGTEAQRHQLETELDKLEEAGLIHYGLFVSRESVMSCYVRDRKDKHIHFVDGADGGYTMAAAIWKRKIARAGS